jgi:chromosome segregation ATPase
MKKSILLPFLLIAAPVICMAQNAPVDTAAELADMKSLKTALTLKSDSLKADGARLQVETDSILAKIATDSAALEEIKAADPVGHKAYIKNQEKLLQLFRGQVARWKQDIESQKAELKKAADLVKEIDDRIAALERRAG